VPETAIPELIRFVIGVFQEIVYATDVVIMGMRCTDEPEIGVARSKILKLFKVTLCLFVVATVD